KQRIDKQKEFKNNQKEFKKNLTDEDKKKFKCSTDEIKYLEELNETEKEEMRNSECVYADPGKGDLIFMMNNKGTTFVYTNRQRLHELHQIKYANQINKFLGIEPKKRNKKKKNRLTKKEKKDRLKQKKETDDNIFAEHNLIVEETIELKNSTENIHDDEIHKTVIKKKRKKKKNKQKKKNQHII